MAELVAAIAASHAPLILSAWNAAPADQRERIERALKDLHRRLSGARPDVVVIAANEHFTNFFLNNFPAFCIGVADGYMAPIEDWLGVEKTIIPGHRSLSEWLLSSGLQHDFDLSFSEELILDHGIVTVLHQLTPGLRCPIVPIIQNCSVSPMPTLRRCYRFGEFLRQAIAEWPVDARVAVVGSGGLSHWVGDPKVGQINETFDRWFLERLASGDVESLMALSDDEMLAAGNGAHEIRSWLTAAGVAGGAPAEVLCYEPVKAWITGIGLALFPVQTR